MAIITASMKWEFLLDITAQGGLVQVARAKCYLIAARVTEAEAHNNFEIGEP